MTRPDVLLRPGQHGPRVRVLRAQLAAVGLEVPPAADDQLYDADVESAVRTFQQRRGLSADGIVGPQTGRALDDAHWTLGDRILRYVPGHLLRGDDVVGLQHRLVDLGFHAERADGLFGPVTEQAVRELQDAVGLVPDGTCGPDTLRALRQLDRTVGGGDATALREGDRVTTTGTSLAGRVVVVDPGHGGGDPGVTAVLTRGAEQDPTAAERAELATTVRADVVLSLHCDRSSPGRGGGGQGVATFYWGGPRNQRPSQVGRRLAGLVQRELVARTDLVDCRTHGRTDDLLRLTPMPAVRVELGYLTDPGDARRLADPAFRDRCAEALLVAVQRLYLPQDEDVATGTLRLADLRARLEADAEDVPPTDGPG